MKEQTYFSPVATLKSRKIMMRNKLAYFGSLLINSKACLPTLRANTALNSVVETDNCCLIK
jgi:hypothetical protein